MKRKIIKINEEKCNGCGLCVPDCPEGALQILDGKARLVSDLFCDGLGACIGNCPEGAIEVEERDAEPYDEIRVMENIVAKGDATIKAHLSHLKNHNADDFYRQAVTYLERNGYDTRKYIEEKPASFHACPGVLAKSLRREEKPHQDAGATDKAEETAGENSWLSNWPVQMHLVNPSSPHFRKSDLLVAADCTAFAAGNFHSSYLKGKTLVIACPKLDNAAEIYEKKIMDLIETGGVNTITLLIMEVPCCRGLSMITREAVRKAARKVPVKEIVISIEGRMLKEEWV